MTDAPTLPAMIWCPLVVPIAVGAVALVLARIEAMIVVRQQAWRIDDDRSETISTYPQRREISNPVPVRDGRGDNHQRMQQRLR